MPLFEYKCQKCGHKFEKLVFGEEEINPVRDSKDRERAQKERISNGVKCPKCGSTSSNKLFSTFSVSTKSQSNNSKSCQGGVCNFNYPTED